MKSDKTFIVAMAVIVAVIIGLLFYYFSGSNVGSGLNKVSGNNTTNNATKPGNGGSNNNTGNSTGNDTGSGNNTIITLSGVDDYDTFFTINTLLNDFYVSQTTNDENAVLNILDQNYIDTHKINKGNVKNFMERNYESISFFTKFMYVKGFNGTKYYFVNGETQSYDFAAEQLYEKSGVNYLVIVDENNHTYSITPIVSDINIFEYAQDYKIKSKTIDLNDNNRYSKTEMNDQLIIAYYITYYKNILYLNSEKAYEMLTNESKNKYVDYETFVRNLDTIYNDLSTNLHSFGSKGTDGKKTFSAVGQNQKRVDFVESGIMNFKVDLTK